MYNYLKSKSIFLLLILVLSNFAVYAQTPTTTTTQTYDVADAGVTPDSFLYNLELAYENFQLAVTVDPVVEAELLTSHLEERHAEMEAMYQQENYDAMATVSEEIQETSESLQETVADIPPTEENLPTIHSVEEQLIYQEEHIETIHEALETQVQSGTLSAETVQEISFTAMEESAVAVQAESENTEDLIVDTIAQEQGITTIEAQLQVEQQAEDTGLLDLQEAEVGSELRELSQSITQLEEQLGTLRQEGTELPNDNQLDQILDESRTQLERCEDYLSHGEIDHAFAELTSSEQLTLTAEQAVNQEPDFDYSELVDLAEEVEQEQQERIDEAEEYIEEYSEISDELAQNYPDRADDFAYFNEQSEKVREISEKFEEVFGSQRDSLISEGKSAEEADQILGERWNQEYRLAYGEEFLPPGIEGEIDPGFAVIPVYDGDGNYLGLRNPDNIGSEPVFDEHGFPIGVDSGSVVLPEEFKVEGGFVKGHEYEDPVSGHKYEITDNGWKYTTPAGITYEESWPEGYTPGQENSYEKGNEIHQSFEKTDEGTVIYNYFATGYEVVLPDGTTETHSYPKGEYESLSGEKIEIEPTGFKVDSGEESSEQYSHKYEYNPEFDNYAAKLDSGELATFWAPEGASEHDKFDYVADANYYAYVSGGESWIYNPAAGSWQSSGGETYKPEATTLAPVGHEGAHAYTTPTGETWTYDAATGSWGSSTGESYNQGTNHYQSAEGQAWSYDSSTGAWTSPTGETHTDTAYTPGTEAATGVSWSYDSSTGSWGSSTGVSWSYDSSTGAWTSPTGETHTDTMSGTYTGTTTDSGYTPPSH
ncbi:MAG: DUF5667 domain-containing protein [Nanoarchaeota archaeon]